MTRSAPAPASGLAVIRIVRAPFVDRRLHARRAWRRCRASWETAITRRRPADRATPRTRRARARRGAAPRRPSPRARSCRSRRSPPAPPSRIDSAASSAAGEARIGATSPGSARIISSMAHGGPCAQLRHIAHGRRRYRLEWPAGQSHFDADEPCHFGALRRAGPLAARAAARPARRRDLRRDHRRRPPAGHPAARLADEARVEERLQCERDGRLRRSPTRREISAREIGASALRVSRTVRSFRSLSSGGVARVVGSGGI